MQCVVVLDACLPFRPGLQLSSGKLVTILDKFQVP